MGIFSSKSKRRREPVQARLRLKDKRKRQTWMKMMGLSVACLIFFAGATYAAHLPNFLLRDVVVAGASEVDSDAVKQTVLDELSGSYGFLFPRANAFLAPRTEIMRALETVFPAIETVKISQRDPHTLLVTVTERKAVAVYCDEVCYRMDGGGFVFAPVSEAGSYIRYEGGITGDPIGQTFPDFENLNELVVDAGKSISRTPRTVVVAENNDVDVTLAEGGVLKFIRTEDTTATLDNIASVFASQSFKSGREFEYADFRYGNKVYVKFKGE